MANITSLPPPLVVPTSGSWYGNDGSWSTFTIAVGNPPQEFAVLPATNVANTWVPIADDCKALNISDCGSKRGVYPFNNTISPGFQSNFSSTWENIGLFELGQNAFLGFSGNGAFGYDTVGLVRGDASQTVQIDHQPVTAYASPDFWLGEIGLGNRGMNLGQHDHPASFLTNLKEAGGIPSRSFGYTAGAPYRSTKVPASLTLGGYDAGRATENLKISLNDDDDRPLTIAVQKIAVSNSFQDDGELPITPFLIPIDSSVPDLWLPKSICDQFESAFGLQYNDLTNRYILESKNHTFLQKNDPVLNFTIGSQLTDGPNITIQLPYAAFDLQAGLPIFADTLNYFPIRRAANESQYMMGRVFLQEAYLTVDYERNYFNVSQANYTLPTPEVKIQGIEPTDMPFNTTSPSDNPSNPAKKEKLSGGVIAGIAIGAVAGIALIAGLVWYFYPKRGKTYELEGGANQPLEMPMKQHPEIGGNEVSELVGDHGKLEFPGEGTVSEVDGVSRLVHELPTPVYELPTPIPEMK
ncbi:acid protease [Bimuria novae-zelandiae CBS 107.79]|uniref:Acid protease n=1 Tax=Bimuria novae-zelandiae CBS 107.79 TaxID=1447943 RepID=A0A6A5VTY4_9PLEO|nr:acid protease [Bimuria novae-zelandiae CBS 107.79]